MTYRVGGGRFGAAYEKPIQTAALSGNKNQAGAIFCSTVELRADFIELRDRRNIAHFFSEEVALNMGGSERLLTPLSFKLRLGSGALAQKVEMGGYVNLKLDWMLLPEADSISGTRVVVLKAKIIG